MSKEEEEDGEVFWQNFEGSTQEDDDLAPDSPSQALSALYHEIAKEEEFSPQRLKKAHTEPQTWDANFLNCQIQELQKEVIQGKRQEAIKRLEARGLTSVASQEAIFQRKQEALKKLEARALASQASQTQAPTSQGFAPIQTQASASQELIQLRKQEALKKLEARGLLRTQASQSQASQSQNPITQLRFPPSPTLTRSTSNPNLMSQPIQPPRRAPNSGTMLQRNPINRILFQTPSSAPQPSSPSSQSQYSLSQAPQPSYSQALITQPIAPPHKRHDDIAIYGDFSQTDFDLALQPTTAQYGLSQAIQADTDFATQGASQYSFTSQDLVTQLSQHMPPQNHQKLFRLSPGEDLLQQDEEILDQPEGAEDQIQVDQQDEELVDQPEDPEETVDQQQDPEEVAPLQGDLILDSDVSFNLQPEEPEEDEATEIPSESSDELMEPTETITHPESPSEASQPDFFQDEIEETESSNEKEKVVISIDDEQAEIASLKNLTSKRSLSQRPINHAFKPLQKRQKIDPKMQIDLTLDDP